MKEIRVLAPKYKKCDIYSMDETVLFCKPSRSSELSIIAYSGAKIDKARILIALCVDADGSDVYPLEYMGNSQMPRFFTENEQLNRNWTWRANSRPWVSFKFMTERLKFFIITWRDRERFVSFSTTSLRTILLLKNFHSYWTLELNFLHRVTHTFWNRLIKNLSTTQVADI